MLLAGLMMAPLLILAMPTAEAAPTCDVQTNRFGIGVICAGPGVIGFCALDLYDTQNTQWAIAGEYVCV